MMKIYRRCPAVAAAMLTLVASPSCVAESWYGDIESGLLYLRGNNNSTSITAKFNLTQQLERWRNNYQVEGLLKKDLNKPKGQQTVAKRYRLAFQTNYEGETDDDKSVFVYSALQRAKYGYYEREYTVASGLAHRVYESDVAWLDMDAGPGLSKRITQAGDSQGGTIFRVSSMFEWQISANARFNQSLSSEISLVGENTQTRAESALSASINSSLSMKMAYTYVHNSLVYDNKLNRDGEAALTFVYNFF